MLLSTLSPILDHAKLTFIMSKLDDGRVCLSVAPTPTGKGDVSALEQPILLKGSVEELDTELLKGMDGGLGRLVQSHMSLAEQIASQQAQMEAAKAASAKSAPKKPAAVAGSVAKPAVSTAERAKALSEGAADAADEQPDDGAPNRLF